MVHIVSDTSTLYSTAQAKEAGFTVAPLSVTIAGKSYREIAEALKCPVQRIEKHMKKNEVIYGPEAVRARALTLELPEP